MRVKSLSELKEGAVFQSWASNRLFRRNQNIIVATTGATGSGKSYQDLRRLELHYQKHFEGKFNIVERLEQNICFSLKQFADRLTSGDLKKGEILLCEEMGVNLGSLDFQAKVSKLFTYILQSFRSENIGIFMNLPVFTMMNKQARQLTHLHITMAGIDKNERKSFSKGKYLQLNQESGKVYAKYLRISLAGVSIPIKRFSYGLPSKELTQVYEAKKKEFVKEQALKLKEHLEVEENGKKFIPTERMRTINYCYHRLKLGNPMAISRKITEIEGLFVSRPSIAQTMVSMDRKEPEWREMPSVLGYSKVVKVLAPLAT